MGFDRTSGLVYREEIARESRHTAARAATRCLGRRPEYVSPAIGSERLTDIAMRKLLCNLESLDSSSLDTIPVVMLEKIWRSICRSQLNSLHVWQAFAQSRIGNRSFVRMLLLPTVGEITFNKSFSLVTNASLAWITHLTISHSNITSADLLEVSTVTNIRKLYVDGSGCITSPMDDRVVRAWADAAIHDGAFSHLGSMLLWAHKGITKWTLERLNLFPKLTEFCAYECSLSHKNLTSAASFGWLEDHNVASVRENCPRDLRTIEGLDDLYLNREWHDAATHSMNRRSEDIANGLDSKPLLKAVFGRVQEKRKGRHWLTADRLVWLQKGDDCLAIITQKSTADGSQSELEAQPTLKKRKVVVSKRVLFDELLGG